MWLSLEQVYKEYDEEGENKLINMIMEDKSKAIREKMRECKTMEEFEDKIFKLQQLEFEEVTGIGRYTGNLLKPLIVVFEDSLKVEKCYHGDYNLDSDKSDYLCHLGDRVNMYIESDSESENGKSSCYFDHTDSDFGDVECNKNLEDVKSNILKNKLVNDFRENIMFVLDQVTNLQEQNLALQKQLEESNLKMKKVSTTSSKVIRKLQA